MTTAVEKAVAVYTPTDLKKIETIEMQLSAVTVISNDKELAKAEELLKVGNALKKAVEAERKAFTSKLDLYKAEAMKHEKRLIAALDAPSLLANSYINKREAARMEQQRIIQQQKEAEAAKIQKGADQKQALIDLELNYKKSIASAKGLRELNALMKELEEYVPTEECFGAGLKEAKKLKTDLIKLAEKQHTSFKEGHKLDIDTEALEEKAVQNQIDSVQKLQDVDVNSQAQQQSLGSATGVKKTWTFETIDINLVPREHLILDTVKVNALIKSGVREILGLKIYQETSRSGR